MNPEQLDALFAIYPDELRLIGSSLQFTHPLNEGTISLLISQYNPIFKLESHIPIKTNPGKFLPIPSYHQKALMDEFMSIRERLQPEDFVFEVIEYFREYSNENLLDFGDQEDQFLDEVGEEQNQEDVDIVPDPSIEILSISEPICDRKSTFTAHCVKLDSKSDLEKFIAIISSRKPFTKSTHNILAYIYTENGVQDKKYDDDGEHGAGSRLLDFMVKAGVNDVAVVVCRGFGGIKLGTIRFKHIVDAAKKLLLEYSLISN